MPSRGHQECRHAGCHKTTATSYCPGHNELQKEKQRARNKTPQNKLYKTSRWYAQRQRVIVKAKGICQVCRRRIEDPKERHVDHVKAVQDTARFWVSDKELQLLCRHCHSKKTMEERRARGEL